MRCRLHLFIILWLILAGCSLPQHANTPARQHNGEVIVYLQPMPQTAEPLRFILKNIFAIRQDEVRIPLNLLVSEIEGSRHTENQRRLAEGILPPGLYRGLSLFIEKAFIRGEEGPTDLLVPESPIRVDLAFEVLRGESAALFLTLKSTGLAGGAVVFRPEFSLRAQEDTLINLTGYVSQTRSHRLTVFNKKTMMVTEVVAVSKNPRDILVDRLRRRAYVACSEEDLVEEIDIQNNRVVERIRLRFGDAPRRLALTPDGRLLLAVNHDSDTLSLIRTISRAELTRIKVGRSPTDVIVTTDGFRAFVVNSLSNNISVIDLRRDRLFASLPVEPYPVRGALNRRGDRLYVISRDSPNLTAVDTDRLAVAAKFYIGIRAVSIIVDPNTDLIYVGKEFGDEIVIVDPVARMPIDTIPVGGSAFDLAIDAEENRLLATLPDQGTLLSINLTSKQIVSQMDAGKDMYAVAVVGER